MVRNLLVRGMLVGLLAGLIAFVFARFFGEPSVAGAIGFEEAAAHAHEHAAGGHEHEEELVSRTTQSGIGLATAIGLYGVAFGGIFSLVFAGVYGRIGRFSPRATAALLGLAGFLAVYLLPFLKYPANPPATSSADTIEERTALYVVAVVASVLSVLLAVYIGRRLVPRFGTWNATLLGVLSLVVLTVIVHLALPTINEVPEHFPAALLWDFRVSAVGMQLVLWTVIALGFGPLASKVLRRGERSAVG